MIYSGHIMFNENLIIQWQDWASPFMRKYIHVYPEITDGPISEVWHAAKWCKDMELDALSQMWDAGDHHFYVNEVCRLHSGNLVVPIRWLAKTHDNGSKSFYADTFAIQIDDMVCGR